MNTALLTAFLASLTVAPGYRIEVFQANVPGARSLAHSPKGTLFVGTRNKEVYAIRSGNLIVIAKDLKAPNGIAYRDGDLYVGETSRIIKYEKIDELLSASPPGPFKPVVVHPKLPEDGGHDWRYMRFAPDGSLYVSIGAPCNICNREKDEPRFSTILRFPKDGTGSEIFARGVRNSMGFDWQPDTGSLWFTDNGRDWLGDDEPDDELNFAPKSGMHFGFPFCHAGKVRDPQLAGKRQCSEFTPPAGKLGAHVAALGMRFLTPDSILVAEHGSWNRSTPSGYQLSRVFLNGGKAVRVEPFVSGFITATGDVRGRPVDVDIQSDGSILVSDDKTNAIYRLVKGQVKK